MIVCGFCCDLPRWRGAHVTRSGWIAVLAAGSMTLAVGALLCKAGLSSPWALFAGLNVATVMCYGYDKHQAMAGKRRVPEAALHVMAAAGGTPGALAGQMLFRHKTRDVRFRRVFWCIAAMQLLALLWIMQIGRR